MHAQLVNATVKVLRAVADMCASTEATVGMRSLVRRTRGRELIECAPMQAHVGDLLVHGSCQAVSGGIC